MPRVTSTMQRRARFSPGDLVQVDSRFPRNGHIRTPFYLRGQRGRIVRFYGHFLDPELLAQGLAGHPAQPLYQVAFVCNDLWDGRAAEGKAVVLADLYENWLHRSEVHHASP